MILDMFKPLKLTRDDLYERVWARPTIHVAAELGISDVMVGKFCRRMDVPKPPLGYWRRKETGKTVKATPLPKAEKETVTAVFLHKIVDRSEDAVPSEIRERIERELLPENQIRIASNLDGAHPLVQKVQKHLETMGRSCAGAVELPRGEGYLNLVVSPVLARRALLIADGLIKGLEDRGYEVAVSEDQWWGEATRISKEGEELELSIFEHISNVRRELTDEEQKKPPYLIVDTHVKRPTGKLCIKIRSHRSTYRLWRDNKEVSLEDQLNEVVIGVIGILEPLVSDKLARAQQQQRRMEASRRAELEKARIEKLEKDAARWAASNEIREYLRAYRARLIEMHGRIPDGSDEAEWLAWAESYVETIDPLNGISTGDK